MALVQWKYERRRRGGTGTKALEQSRDWPRLVEHLIKLSEAHGAHETAAELREQLRNCANPQPIATIVAPEPAVYTDEPPKAARKPKRKTPPSSADRKLREAWRTVDQLRGRSD